MENIYCEYCNSLIINNERCSSCGAPITKNNKIVTINILRKAINITKNNVYRGGCRL